MMLTLQKLFCFCLEQALISKLDGPFRMRSGKFAGILVRPGYDETLIGLGSRDMTVVMSAVCSAIKLPVRKAPSRGRPSSFTLRLLRLWQCALAPASPNQLQAKCQTFHTISQQCLIEDGSQNLVIRW